MATYLRLPRRTSLLEFLFLLAFAFGLFYFFLLPSHHEHQDIGPPKRAKLRRKRPDTPLPCSQLPGANDTTVVLKTSAAEIEDRLPIHFDTTLLCYPNYVIFSDYAEKYEGYPIHDALATVDRKVKKTHPDFELWRRLKRHGPDGLEDEELWDPDKTVKDLDKWKHLSMLEQTFMKYPEKKWYVLLETDTFIFWSNLLQWLRRLDHTRPYYIGAEKVVGEIDVAKGGSGFVLSHHAMESVVKLYQETRAAWAAYTERQTSGDVILAQALSEVGVSLTPAWPIFQSHRPADMEYDRVLQGRRLWCYPTISYHGISEANIDEMWKFEQGWIKENPNAPIRHHTIFNSFILPRLLVRSGRVDDWDNFSGDFSSQGTPASDVDKCRGTCVADSKCVQYAFANGTCVFSNVPKMGDFKPGVESRWLLARVKRFGEEMEECQGNEGWVQ